MYWLKEKNRLSAFAAALVVIACAIPVQATTVYDEAISGDLLNADFGNPTGHSSGTALGTFSVGSNTVVGEMGNVSGASDDDIFTFVVPSGHQLDAILLGYTASGGGVGTGSYFAINDGPYVATLGSLTSDNLGDALTETPGDIMADLQLGTTLSNAAGLQIPSPAGTYSLFLSEFNGALVNYSLDFQLSAVPEPASAVLMSFALLMGAVSPRKFRSTHSEWRR